DVNTRGNASTFLAVPVCREARTEQRSIVWSRSSPCCSLLRPEVSQTCSQLIHTRFVVVLASWLETRNPLQNRQEKNEFNFQFRKKNFLDGKNEARLRENEARSRKNYVQPKPVSFENRPRVDFAAD